MALRTACVMALFVAGCATNTPTRFHSLLPPPAASAPAAAPSFELAPVRVAVAVDRPQFVLRLPDGTMQLLEHERWISPLADELHAALVLHLAGHAAAGPVTATASPPWRVALDVRRWDATLGGVNRLEVLWMLRRGSEAPRTCQAVLEQPAGATVDALAASHRSIVVRLAQQVAASVRGC